MNKICFPFFCPRIETREGMMLYVFLEWKYLSQAILLHIFLFSFFSKRKVVQCITPDTFRKIYHRSFPAKRFYCLKISPEQIVSNSKLNSDSVSFVRCTELPLSFIKGSVSRDFRPLVSNKTMWCLKILLWKLLWK